MAHDAGHVSLHAKVKVRVPNWRDDERVYEVVETTPGRAQLANILPENPAVLFSIVNKLMTKKEISNVIDHVYRYCGQKDTVIFCDHLMGMASAKLVRREFPLALMISTTPRTPRANLSVKLRSRSREFEQQYQDGLITQARNTIKSWMYGRVAPIWLLMK